MNILLFILGYTIIGYMIVYTTRCVLKKYKKDVYESEYEQFEADIKDEVEEVFDYGETLDVVSYVLEMIFYLLAWPGKEWELLGCF